MKISTAAMLMMFLCIGTTLQAKDGVSFFADGGAGAIVSGNENVSASPVVKADVGVTLNDMLMFGLGIGQALHFNEKNRVLGLVGNKQPVQSYAPLAPSFAPHSDDDVVIINNNTNVTVSVIPTKVPAPFEQDLNEQSYFFGEPFVGIGLPIGFHIFNAVEPDLTLTPYLKTFMGAARITTHDGVRDTGTSYGWGGGFKLSSLDRLFFSVEYLHRNIEVWNNQWTGEQFTGNIGVNF